MSEATLASAVAVPDQDNIRQSPTLPTKRRKSSTTEHEPKRPRLSEQDDLSPHAQRQRPSDPNAESTPAENDVTEKKPARKGGREEDRKRGQRLFGSLLGTLSQTSSSAAQKRRADIEKRQQDKLKSQAHEYDGLKKKRRERRDLIRKKEQPFYEREAMQTRHDNMLATAHFLKTQTKPVLYYKPWQYRPGDEDIIKAQIKDAEEEIAREVESFEARFPPEAFLPGDIESTPAVKEQTEQAQEEKTEDGPTMPQNEVPEYTSKHTDKPKEEVESPGTHVESTPKDKIDSTPAAGENNPEQHDAHRDDDGGEVVEDNEDTVIY